MTGSRSAHVRRHESRVAARRPVPLQTHTRSPLALELKQRAFLCGLKSGLGKFGAGPLLVEFSGEIGAGLHKSSVPLTQCLLRPCQLAFECVTCRRCCGLSLFEFLDVHLRGEQCARPLLERHFGTRQISLQCGDRSLSRRPQ